MKAPPQQRSLRKAAMEAPPQQRSLRKAATMKAPPPQRSLRQVAMKVFTASRIPQTIFCPDSLDAYDSELLPSSPSPQCSRPKAIMKVPTKGFTASKTARTIVCPDVNLGHKSRGSRVIIGEGCYFLDMESTARGERGCRWMVFRGRRVMSG